MDGVHDLGGMHGFGPVDVTATGSGHEGWETRLQVVALLSGGITRQGIEAIEPATYLSAGYHERWLIAAERRLLHRGLIDPSALARWQAMFSGDPEATAPRSENASQVSAVDATLHRSFRFAPASAPRFSVGDRVRVRRMRPEHHHRCPRYLRGVVGEVEKVVGQDHVPGLRASEARSEPVYTVRFVSTDLWGRSVDVVEAPADGPTAEPPFDVFVDLWQSYLEAP